MSLLAHVVLTVAAFLGATISGVLGMAGGIFLLAIMLLFMEPALAIPLHAAVQLCSNSTRILAYRQHLRWRPFAWFAVMALPFPLLGLALFQALDPTALRILMAVAILYATWAPRWGLERLPEGVAFSLAGVVVGTLGPVIGAVGPLTAPFFLREGFTREQLVGTKAICQAYGHLLKIAAFATLGLTLLDEVTLLLPMILAVVAGTYLGRYLQRRLSEARFRLAYRCVLTCMAVLLPLKPMLQTWMG